MDDEAKALVCVHAENHGVIAWMVKRLIDKGYTAPKYHAVSHARVSESEAFTRLIAFSELLDQPVMIFHVSTREGAAVIREARGRGVKIFAETCPQYLFLTADDLARPDDVRQQGRVVARAGADLKGAQAGGGAQVFQHLGHQGRLARRTDRHGRRPARGGAEPRRQCAVAVDKSDLGRT